MKTRTLLASVALVAISISANAANPFLPLWEYIPDGEPYVFEDPDAPGKMRVYVYGSHDNLRGKYCGRDQVVWSAPVEDLNKWRFDGVVFRSLNGADGRPLNKNGLGDVLYAPDVAEVKGPDGKKTYYLYPNTQAWGRNNMVAKSDRPDGPFEVCNWDEKDPKKTVGPFGFDPAILVDDDGRVYGYWGFCRSFAAELDPKTMATVKPGAKIVEDMVSSCKAEGDFRFFEASSIRKRRVRPRRIELHARIRVFRQAARSVDIRRDDHRRTRTREGAGRKDRRHGYARRQHPRVHLRDQRTVVCFLPPPVRSRPVLAPGDGRSDHCRGRGRSRRESNNLRGGVYVPGIRTWRS